MKKYLNPNNPLNFCVSYLAMLILIGIVFLLVLSYKHNSDIDKIITILEEPVNVEATLEE